MKVRIRDFRSGDVVCEIRCNIDEYKNLPYIGVSSNYAIDYLTDDNILFDTKTGEIIGKKGI